MYAVLIEVDTSGQPDQALGLKGLREEIVPGVSNSNSTGRCNGA
jgi:hypothetical protein